MRYASALWKGGWLTVAASMLPGCTHLEVQRHTEKDPARAGYAYTLDFTQYEIELKRTLMVCDGSNAPDIKTEVKISTSLVPDSEQVYVINPQSMISAFKTSDITVNYKDGRLAGFNAATEDKTAEGITAVAATAGKIASLAFKVPYQASEQSLTSTDVCTAEAIRNLETIEANKPHIQAVTAQLDDARSQLAVLTAQFAAKPTDDLRVQIAERSRHIEAAQKASDRLVKSSSDAQAWLIDTVTVTWPQTSLVFDQESAFPLSWSKLGKWFQLAQIRAEFARDEAPSTLENEGVVQLRNFDGPENNAKRLNLSREAFSKRYPLLVEPFDRNKCPNADTCAQLDRLTADLRKPDEAEAIAQLQSAVSLHIVPQGTYGRTGIVQDASNDARDGLRYRVPAAGWLYVCARRDECTSGGPAEPLIRVAGPVAQLGTVFNIPFSSPVFASGSVGVTFDEQGRLTSAGLKRDNAAALSAANATGAVVDQANKLATTMQNAPLAEVQRQTALAKARKDLEAAEAALVKTPTDKLNEELALLEAQAKVEAARTKLGPNRFKDLTNEVAIAKLEAELSETRSRYVLDPQSDQAAVFRQYEAQELLLNARKSALEAQAAVLEAERTLAAARVP